MLTSLVYLARLREAFGRASEQIELPAGATDVASLLALLRSRGGAWETELGPGRAVRVAVNRELAKADAAIHPGDEVALLPPVTGG